MSRYSVLSLVLLGCLPLASVDVSAATEVVFVHGKTLEIESYRQEGNAVWLRLPGGGEMVIVELASGRSFQAELDPRTDASRLWLRAREGTAELLRPVHWDRVVRATVAGEQLSGEQLRAVVADIRTRVPAQPVRPTTPVWDRAARWLTASRWGASRRPSESRPTLQLRLS